MPNLLQVSSALGGTHGGVDRTWTNKTIRAVLRAQRGARVEQAALSRVLAVRGTAGVAANVDLDAHFDGLTPLFQFQLGERALQEDGAVDRTLTALDAYAAPKRTTKGCVSSTGGRGPISTSLRCWCHGAPRSAADNGEPATSCSVPLGEPVPLLQTP